MNYAMYGQRVIGTLLEYGGTAARRGLFLSRSFNLAAHGEDSAKETAASFA